MTVFPSSLVFNSMLPLSPSSWKMTAAFSMGFTVLVAQDGYLDPRGRRRSLVFASAMRVESCAKAARPDGQPEDDCGCDEMDGNGGTT